MMERLQELFTDLRGFLYFASVYDLTKCLKAMLCGTAVMPFLFLFRGICRKKNATAGCHIMLLLIPMTLMGMSKLFYQRYFIIITALLTKYMKAWYGCVYFGIVLLLAAIYACNVRRSRRFLGTCRQVQDREMIESAIRTVTCGDRNGVHKRYLERVEVYAASTDESPFSGGIFRPYIVMPESMLEAQDQKSCSVVLCHELIHIRSGHIIWLTLFKFLTFLWWIDPFIYLCEAALKEDIEHACDEGCIFYTGISKRGYGNVLLAMTEQMIGVRKAATASFMNRNDYVILKKRLGYIAGRGSGDYQRCRRRDLRRFLAAMSVLVAMILATSYPRYTLQREVTVFDGSLQTIAYEEPFVQEIFSVEDRKLLIDEEKFEEFIASEHITGDYVYVSFNTIMKLPGMGGLGNVGMVNVEDAEDIFYLGADTTYNRIMEFCLKYLI